MVGLVGLINEFKLKKAIVSTNIETDEKRYFKSKSQASKYYGCSPALVYLICEKLNNCNTYMNKIKFEYCNDLTDKEITEKPDARIGKSKYTPEQKKAKRNEYAKKYYIKIREIDLIIGFRKDLCKERNKKARHPVGLFRIWLLDMTPVVSHDPDA